MRLTIFILGLFAGLASTFAQISKASPQKPLLPRAPAMASWTITFKYKEEDTKSSPEKPLHSQNVRMVTVTKTNKIYREEVTLISGEKFEKWVIDGTHFKTIPNSPSILLIPPPTVNSPEPEYTDYAQTDFPDLTWISLANYQGVASAQGKQTFRFDAEEKSAFLLLDSQLPLMFTDGTSTCTYTFNSPPSSVLTPPKNFLDALEIHRRGVEALKYHPVPM